MSAGKKGQQQNRRLSTYVGMGTHAKYNNRVFSTGKEAATSGAKRLQSTAHAFTP